MLVIRLSRGGRTHLPAYSIVVAEKSNRRDGKFVEKIGYYQPILKNDDPFRMNLSEKAYKKWIDVGAKPSERVEWIAYKLGYIEKPVYTEKPKKSASKQK